MFFKLSISKKIKEAYKSKRTIKELLKLKIYDLPENKIDLIINELCDNDIKKLINKINTTTKVIN